MPWPPASTPIRRTCFVFEEGVEDADGIAAAADAGDDGIGQAPGAVLAVEHLVERLAADDALEVAHHRRVGMRAKRAAEQVVGGAHVGHPIADGLVDGILERLAAALHAAHLGAQQLHAEDVGLLARHVDRAHVDDALDAEHGGDGGRGDAMLTGAGLGDDARLAHLALHQQRLAQRVVDLVRAGVGQVFALEVDLRAAEMLAQPAGIGDRRGPADKGALQDRQVPPETPCRCAALR